MKQVEGKIVARAEMSSNGVKGGNIKRGGVHPYSPPPGSLTAQQVQEAQSLAVHVHLRRKKHPWRPWLVPTIVVACIVVFVVTMYKNNCPKKSPGQCMATWLGRFSFQKWESNPLLGPRGDTLRGMGALEWNAVVKQDQVWRMITCMWLHAGVIHLLANMLGLIVIGLSLEQEFGFVRVGFIYIVSGFAGSTLSTLFNRYMISVGASGALFGLLGAIVSELLINWSIYTSRCADLISLVFIVVVNLVLGLMPHVDNFAHLGGFAAGFLLGFVLLIRPQWGWVKRQQELPLGGAAPTATVISKYKPYQIVLWVVGAVLLVLGLTAGTIALFRGVDGNEKCRWCHYLTCVPTSRWSCDNEG